MPKISDTLERAPVSHIPRAVATSALLTSKKMSGKSKRLFLRARGQAIQIESSDPKGIQAKYCGKLKRLSLVQLDHRWAQACRRIRRAEELLSTLAPDSQYRKPLEQEKTMWQYFRGWILEECDSRVKA